MTTHPPLSLRAYWQIVGSDAVREVCRLAGTSFAYYRMMMYHFKGCSPEMLERLEAAAATVTPGVKPDYALCTRPSLIAAARDERAARGQALRTARLAGERRLRPSRTTRTPA